MIGMGLSPGRDGCYRLWQFDADRPRWGKSNQYRSVESEQAILSRRAGCAGGSERDEWARGDVMTSFLARDHLPRASLRCRVAWVLTVSRFLAELQLSFTVVILETTYNNPGDC
jgi:hypothetical protein